MVIWTVNWRQTLSAAGFTGNIEPTFRQRLQANLDSPINPELANLGRLLWFAVMPSESYRKNRRALTVPALVGGIQSRNFKAA
jgi:hypothetical protein